MQTSYKHFAFIECLGSIDFVTAHKEQWKAEKNGLLDY